jgi:hypothetical protein
LDDSYLDSETSSFIKKADNSDYEYYSEEDENNNAGINILDELTAENIGGAKNSLTPQPNSQ